MAVSKRVRFEVMKRDKFRCTYCGLPAAETGEGLTIDHVMPVSLGGTDAPTNLVTACKDCNAGKTSATLGDESVAPAVDLESQILAIEARRASIRGELERVDEITFDFEFLWKRWHFGNDETKTIPLPHDWRQTIFELWRSGAPQELFAYAIPIAMSNADRKYGEYAEFRYVVGIVRNKLAEHGLEYDLTPQTAKLFTKYDLEKYGYESYNEAVDDLRSKALDSIMFDNLVRHIDGRLT